MIHVSQKRVLLNLGLLLDSQDIVAAKLAFHLHLVRRLQSFLSEVEVINYL